jgi:hypothetical protein
MRDSLSFTLDQENAKNIAATVKIGSQEDEITEMDFSLMPKEILLLLVHSRKS